MSKIVKTIRLYHILHIVAVVSMLLYSFTQVDLNLTLSRISLVFAIQDFFQYIGYFERSLSTWLYSACIVLLYTSYAFVLYKTRKNKVSVGGVWMLVISTCILLLVSYPAFSYDIYNYMFDSRIVTEYGQNPYVHKALDYPSDPWINFMRWTHRTYPYGPLWIAMTVPLTFVTGGTFLPALFLFKALMMISYIISVWAIYHIQKNVFPEHALLSMVAFALNPLVIVESLVSSHNDIVMMALALMGLYGLVVNSYVRYGAMLILSVLIKFATGALLPVFLWVWWVRNRINRTNKTNKTYMEAVFLVCLCCMGLAVIAATVRTQFQPWYLLYVIPFASLLFHKYYVSIPMVVVSIAGLLQYVPFLYRGNWDPPVPDILNWVMIGGVGLSFMIVTGAFVLKTKRR